MCGSGSTGSEHSSCLDFNEQTLELCLDSVIVVHRLRWPQPCQKQPSKLSLHIFQAIREHYNSIHYTCRNEPTCNAKRTSMTFLIWSLDIALSSEDTAETLQYSRIECHCCKRRWLINWSEGILHLQLTKCQSYVMNIQLRKMLIASADPSMLAHQGLHKRKHSGQR